MTYVGRCRVESIEVEKNLKLVTKNIDSSDVLCDSWVCVGSPHGSCLDFCLGLGSEQ